MQRQCQKQKQKIPSSAAVHAQERLQDLRKRLETLATARWASPADTSICTANPKAAAAPRVTLIQCHHVSMSIQRLDSSSAAAALHCVCETFQLEELAARLCEIIRVEFHCLAELHCPADEQGILLAVELLTALVALVKQAAASMPKSSVPQAGKELMTTVNTRFFDCLLYGSMRLWWTEFWPQCMHWLTPVKQFVFSEHMFPSAPTALYKVVSSFCDSLPPIDVGSPHNSDAWADKGYQESCFRWLYAAGCSINEILMSPAADACSKRDHNALAQMSCDLKRLIDQIRCIGQNATTCSTYFQSCPKSTDSNSGLEPLVNDGMQEVKGKSTEKQTHMEFIERHHHDHTTQSELKERKQSEPVVRASSTPAVTSMVGLHQAALADQLQVNNVLEVMMCMNDQSPAELALHFAHSTQREVSKIVDLWVDKGTEDNDLVKFVGEEDALETVKDEAAHSFRKIETLTVLLQILLEQSFTEAFSELLVHRLLESILQGGASLPPDSLLPICYPIFKLTLCPMLVHQAADELWKMVGKEPDGNCEMQPAWIHAAGHLACEIEGVLEKEGGASYTATANTIKVMQFLRHAAMLHLKWIGWHREEVCDVRPRSLGSARVCGFSSSEAGLSEAGLSEAEVSSDVSACGSERSQSPSYDRASDIEDFIDTTPAHNSYGFLHSALYSSRNSGRLPKDNDEDLECGPSASTKIKTFCAAALVPDWQLRSRRIAKMHGGPPHISQDERHKRPSSSASRSAIGTSKRRRSV